MRWRLHPVHRSRSPGSTEILQNCVVRNASELDQCVTRVARQHFDLVLIDEEIQLSSSSILLSQDSQLMLRVPLLLADVAHQRVSKAPGGLSSFVLGVLPRNRFQEASTKAWIFLVGPCSMKEFQEHLWILGSHGAVRRDMDGALSLTKTVLGAGGCGKVFSANKWDYTGEHIEANSAVKELLPKGKPMECSLRTELEFLAAAQGHPNVAVLMGVFHQLENGEETPVLKVPGCPEDEATVDQELPRERWLIAMQLYSGDLFERVQRTGPLKEAECVEIILGLLSALAYVHHLGIIHRDVKCENLLLDGSRVVLADFGISCYMSDAENMEKRVGSPGYASPEMLKGESYNEKIDVFATGVVLYFALSRTLPFAESSVARVLARTVRCKIRWPQDKFNHFSGGLVKLCKSLLSKEPHLRPSAATAFAAMWALLRPKERQVESVMQSLHAMPKRSSSSRVAPTAPSTPQMSLPTPSDHTRSGSPWRKLMESRHTVRKDSNRSRHKATEDSGEDECLNDFLSSKGGGDLAKAATTKATEKPTGFIRRRLNKFFGTLQRRKGSKVIPVKATDYEGLEAKGVGFDALMPESKEDYVESRHATSSPKRDSIDLE